MLRRWPVSRATVYRAIKRGELAPPVRISKRRVAWPKPVVDQFLRAFVMAELGKALILRRRTSLQPRGVTVRCQPRPVFLPMTNEEQP